jgi:hypothetical protein
MSKLLIQTLVEIAAVASACAAGGIEAGLCVFWLLWRLNLQDQTP